MPAENESEEAFLRVLNVNLNGAFYCAQRFGRVMLEAGRGSIINVASIFGFVASGSIPQAGYVASKGAGCLELRDRSDDCGRRRLDGHLAPPQRSFRIWRILWSASNFAGSTGWAVTVPVAKTRSNAASTSATGTRAVPKT